MASGPKGAPQSCEIFASHEMLMSEFKSYADLTGMHHVAIDPAQVWLISNKPYVTGVPFFNLILQFLLTLSEFKSTLKRDGWETCGTSL